MPGIRPTDLPGLIRLLEHVRTPRRKREHGDAVKRRIALALLIREGDTTGDVLSRHPELAPDVPTLARRINAMRSFLPLPARAHLPPWEVAQAYLRHQFPGYRESIGIH